ncbi:nickel-responsive transcriptional regulator NikR [Consotaella salsifontis]|uniref:Putative nickel-responsive regulator n=1 Tax=Consotaella salsifontis TaxID=1365950 RepID=A0A1T4NYV9_9HYPH|nr:nickel-responsive transcriptional regulator NikR [Consotaella salsifontis]SJZ84464.1 transcriptional regulator, CopG family [Consotaella salsifontis]
MQRVTITLDEDLLAEVDRFASERGYQGRSEAVRDLVRDGLLQKSDSTADEGPGVAALVYVYDHAARELSKRLTRTFHSHHHLSLSSLHVHLDSDTCMEVSVLRGELADIRDMGAQIIAERGVRYGQVVAVPLERSVESEGKGGHSHHNDHSHEDGSSHSHSHSHGQTKDD